MQHFIDSLAGPHADVEQLVRMGHDLEKNANQSSTSVIQKHISFVVTRWSLLEEQSKESFISLKVLTVLL